MAIQTEVQSNESTPFVDQSDDPTMSRVNENVRASQEGNDRSGDDQSRAENYQWDGRQEQKTASDLEAEYQRLQEQTGRSKPQAPGELNDRFARGDDGSDQTRQGEQQATDSPSDQSILPGIGNNVVEEMSAYAWETGELTEEHYETLERAGYNRQMVDDYMAGQFARAEAQERQLVEIGGGERQVEDMFAWARNNMTEQQIQAYDSRFNEGGEVAMMAMEHLRLQYENSGQAFGARMVQGANAPQFETSTFANSDEVVHAINDPRYDYDEKYRAEVDRKLARSDIMTGKVVGGVHRYG